MAQRQSPRRGASATPPVPGPNEDLFRAWGMVYDFQRARIEHMYAGDDEAGDVLPFFFGLVYTHPSRRRNFERRDRAFIRIARGTLLRLITSAELIEYLETVILLKEETDRIDLAVAGRILENNGAPGSDALAEEEYRRAAAAVPREQRLRRLEAVMKSYKLCREVIYNIPFSLDEIFRFTPKVFMRNSDLLDLCAESYRVFHRHKPKLDEFGLIIRERETGWINSLYNGEKA